MKEKMVPGQIVNYKTILTERDVEKRKTDKTYCPFNYEDDIGFVLDVIYNPENKTRDYVLVLKRDGTVSEMYFKNYEFTIAKTNPKMEKAFIKYFEFYVKTKKLQEKHDLMNIKMNIHRLKTAEQKSEKENSIKKVSNLISFNEFRDIVVKTVESRFPEFDDYDGCPRYYINCYSFGKTIKSNKIVKDLCFSLKFQIDCDKYPQPEHYSFLERRYDGTITIASEDDDNYKRSVKRCLYNYSDKLDFAEPSKKENAFLGCDGDYLYFEMTRKYEFELDDFTEDLAYKIADKICRNKRAKTKPVVTKKDEMTKDVFLASLYSEIRKIFKDIELYDYHWELEDEGNLFKVSATHTCVVDRNPTPKTYSFVKEVDDKLYVSERKTKSHSSLIDNLFEECSYKFDLLSKPETLTKTLYINDNNELYFKATACYVFEITKLNKKNVISCIMSIFNV